MFKAFLRLLLLVIAIIAVHYIMQSFLLSSDNIKFFRVVMRKFIFYFYNLHVVSNPKLVVLYPLLSFCNYFTYT